MINSYTISKSPTTTLRNELNRANRKPMAKTRFLLQLLLTSRISSLTQTQYDYKGECDYVNGFPFLAEGLDVCSLRSANANGHKYVNLEGGR